jgi:hypothetical protein
LIFQVCHYSRSHRVERSQHGEAGMRPWRRAQGRQGRTQDDLFKKTYVNEDRGRVVLNVSLSQGLHDVFLTPRLESSDLCFDSDVNDSILIRIRNEFSLSAADFRAAGFVLWLCMGSALTKGFLPVTRSMFSPIVKWRRLLFDAVVNVTCDQWVEIIAQRSQKEENEIDLFKFIDELAAFHS